MGPRTTITSVHVGDLVRREADGIGWHYGVLVGNGRVVDIQKDRNGFARTREISLPAFARGRRVLLEPGPATVNEAAVIKRANALLGGGRLKYGLLGLGGVNCEHVARFVQTGRSWSKQAQIGSFLLLAGAAYFLLRKA